MSELRYLPAMEIIVQALRLILWVTPRGSRSDHWYDKPKAVTAGRFM
jgi:hypothetical protein